MVSGALVVQCRTAGSRYCMMPREAWRGWGGWCWEWQYEERITFVSSYLVAEVAMALAECILMIWLRYAVLSQPSGENNEVGLRARGEESVPHRDRRDFSDGLWAKDIASVFVWR